MQEDILALIGCKYPSLTRAEKGVADYIVQNSLSVLSMSITDLAHACGVGESTVSRFCGHIGAQGYARFRTHLALAIRAHREHAETLEHAKTAEERAEACARAALKDYTAILKNTRDMLTPSALSQAAHRLTEARRILLMGSGGALASMLNAYQRLTHTTSKVLYTPDSHAQQVLWTTLGPTDAVIVFCYCGTVPETVALAAEARRAGAFVLAISRYADTPLSAEANQTLLVDGFATAHPYRPASVCATAFLIDTLCRLYALEADGGDRAPSQLTNEI